MDSRVRIKDHWNEQRIFSQRTLGAFVVMTILILSLIGRLTYLQVLRHDYYVGLSQGNRVRLDPIPASRGLIRDRNGVIMADNEPAYQLELIREQVPDLNDTLKRLSVLGLIDPDSLEDTRRVIFSRRSFDSVPVRLRLTDEEIGRFAVHRYQFPGVDLATRQTRHYPYGELAVHALGYVSAISEQDLEHIDRNTYAGTTLIGKLGVENTYETALHGKNGYREILVNALGRSVQREGAFAPDLHSQAPTAGEDLVLSLDLPTQQAAEDGLGAHRGAVVAIDPNTGDVLALASRPGFDPAAFARGLSRNEFAALNDDIDKPLFNRALRGMYPSGSTIKPVIALAGLTYHVVDPNRQEFCAGVFHLPGSALLFREGKTGRHGYVDLVHAIGRSCDVYFYGLASTIGVERIAAFMAPFGYGELTGIDIAGEKPGILPSPEWKKKTFKSPADQVWYPGETVNFGVGQGYLLVTPVQLAHVASVIAERGKSFRPRLVTGVRSADGHVTPNAPLENPAISTVSAADWDTVFKGMEGATTCTPACGTAAGPFKGVGYAVAGKTGTAQVFTVKRSEKLTDKEPERLRDHSWFIAFAPVEAPRIAVAVLVENGGFGSAVAAPIARKVMDAYLLHKETPKEVETATSQSEAVIELENNSIARTRRTLSASAKLLSALNLDGPLLVGLTLLAIYGLVILYSASGQSLDTIFRTLIRIALGAAAMLALTHASPNFLRRISPWVFVIGVLLLLVVEVTGVIGKGAQRWLNLGFFRFQPSEIMKLGVPMMAAWYLHDRPLPPNWSALLAVAIIIFVPVGLVAIEPDLGTAALIAASGALLVLMAGLSMRIVLVLMLLGVAAAFGGWHFLHDYQRQRVLTFLNPQTDPLGAGYHTIQAQIALGSGGVFGKGWMQGSQAQLQFLPERSTDFIFAVVGEEFGLIGLIALIALYLFIIARAVWLAMQTNDTYSRLLALSIALTFFVYVFINAGMVSGLVPVVGVPLPLVSYGGTSVVTLLAGFGILMGLYSHRKLVGS